MLDRPTDRQKTRHSEFICLLSPFELWRNVRNGLTACFDFPCFRQLSPIVSASNPLANSGKIASVDNIDHSRNTMSRNDVKRGKFSSLFTLTSSLRKAFTLAEVLIVIGILGVLAEMTIPTLINNIQEQVLLTQFKKVYSTLSQAYLSTAQENGTVDTWTSAQDAYNYMKSSLRITEDCPKTVGCFPKSLYKTIKGGANADFYSDSSTYKIRLSDGTSIVFGLSWEGLSVMYVDINGDKAPNQWGKDFFVFQLKNKSGAPVVVGYDPGWSADGKFCSLTQDATGWIDGGSCSSWVIKNGNMDYLHRNISAAEWAN